ncbi:MAG: C39 family peptidase [Enterococcus sp.]
MRKINVHYLGRFVLIGLMSLLFFQLMSGNFLARAFQWWENVERKESRSSTQSSSYFPPASLENNATIQLDVPLESQYTEPTLENGCEITALSMLLQYYGYSTNKNELAQLLNYVPVYESNGLHGNPNEGFVGNIYEGLDAMGVYVQPVAQVAQEVVTKKHQVIANKTTSFTDILAIVREGDPVWILATVDLVVPKASDWRIWQTNAGEIPVTSLIHSVVITGVSEETVMVNDPYGYKNRKVAKTTLAEIYQAMDQQSLYLQSNQ